MLMLLKSRKHSLMKHIQTNMMPFMRFTILLKMHMPHVMNLSSMKIFKPTTLNRQTLTSVYLMVTSQPLKRKQAMLRTTELLSLILSGQHPILHQRISSRFGLNPLKNRHRPTTACMQDVGSKALVTQLTTPMITSSGIQSVTAWTKTLMLSSRKATHGGKNTPWNTLAT